jgi:hypothetical protein
MRGGKPCGERGVHTVDALDQSAGRLTLAALRMLIDIADEPINRDYFLDATASIVAH